MRRIAGVLFTFCFLNVSFLFTEEKIKFGVSTALTGEAASYGIDLKNALVFANDRLGQGRYEFVFEDDKCNGKDAVVAARRLIDVHKVKYVIGFACSSTILSTAPPLRKRWSSGDGNKRFRSRHLFCGGSRVSNFSE